MGTDLERRIRRLEEKWPSPPCGHPFAVLIDPTEEEIEAAHEQLEACPQCNKPGSRPQFIIFHNFGKPKEDPKLEEVKESEAEQGLPENGLRFLKF